MTNAPKYNKLSLSVCFALLLFTHCSLTDDDDSDLVYAFAVQACGPADGPAFLVFITTTEVGCDWLPPRVVGEAPEASYLQIWILGTRDPTLPSLFEFDDKEASSPSPFEGAWAELCLKDSMCASATGGSVRFTVGSRDADVRMSLNATFENGSQVTSNYRLRRCERQVLCG